MLNSLIANKSTERILYFLILNEKCYATQLCQRFNLPLTPLQYALKKLENGGLLQSRYEGKTRYYTFNEDFPLLAELKALMKRAYTLLPIEHKKLYYIPSFPNKPSRLRKGIGPQSLQSQTIVQTTWDKLCEVQTLCFSAKSKSLSVATGWNGLGKGDVEIKQIDASTLIFQERGTWTSEENKQFEFSNVFRWILHLSQGKISLEHLRFGPQNPVFLFSFSPIDHNILESLESHECKEDSYFGQLRCDKHFIQLNWRVIGPKKNEEIDYLYT